MKEYKSHKTVKAAKITAIDTAAGAVEGWEIRIHTDDGGATEYKKNAAIFARYMPVVGDYFVVYSDEYVSFSPAKAFEEGYAEAADPHMVPSTSEARTVNNVMRHAYRVLSEQEKADMLLIKDAGLAFYNVLHAIGGTDPAADRFASRHLSLAATAAEEAVMWGVKHVTK